MEGVTKRLLGIERCSLEHPEHKCGVLRVVFTQACWRYVLSPSRYPPEGTVSREPEQMQRRLFCCTAQSRHYTGVCAHYCTLVCRTFPKNCHFPFFFHSAYFFKICAVFEVPNVYFQAKYFPRDFLCLQAKTLPVGCRFLVGFTAKDDDYTIRQKGGPIGPSRTKYRF